MRTCWSNMPTRLCKDVISRMAESFMKCGHWACASASTQHFYSGLLWMETQRNQPFALLYVNQGQYYPVC